MRESRIVVAAREIQKLADELVAGGMRAEDVRTAMLRVEVKPISYPKKKR